MRDAIPGNESGTIIFRGEDITQSSIDERARLGIGMVFQHPPAVRGVKLRDMLRICMEKSGAFYEERINEAARYCLPVGS